MSEQGATNFTIKNIEDLFLYSTDVENLFIGEYLPNAPGDYVKVYLYGLMYAKGSISIKTKELAESLGLSESQTVEAWKYWSNRGLVQIVSENEDDIRIVFIRQIDYLYGHKRIANNPEKTVNSISEEEKNSLQELFQEIEDATGKLLSKSNMEKVSDAINIYGVEPAVFSYAINYSHEIEKTSIDYICKVAINWTKEGCKTIEDVRALIDESSKRNSYYKSVFHELGFNRPPNPGDREIMDKWFDDYGLSIKEVIEASHSAAGIREPSLKYVDAIIVNRIKEKGGISPQKTNNKPGESKVSKKVLREYFEYLREQERKQAKKRENEVSVKIPQIKALLDEEMEYNKMIRIYSFGAENKKLRHETKSKLEDINSEIHRLLSLEGLPEDYLEYHPKCKICQDTGITEDGNYCECSKIRAEEAYQWNLRRS